MRDFDAKPKGGATVGIAAALLAISACAGGDRNGADSSPAAVAAVSITHPLLSSNLSIQAPVAPRTQPVHRTYWVNNPHADRAQASARADLRAAYIQTVQATAGADYQPQQSGSELVLLQNPRHNLHAELQAGSAHFLIESSADATDAPHNAALAFTGYGCATAFARPLAAVQPVRPELKDQRVVFVRDTVTEWYQNGPLGVEQGFDLAARPACTGTAVVLEMALTSDLLPSLIEQNGKRWLELRDDQGRTALRYSDLYAFDADGKTLPATMALAGGKLRLSIEDAGARYPLHVDPLIWAQIGSAHTPTMPTPVADDGFGTAIAVSGDTVIVGAPFTDGPAVDNGSAFIFTRAMAGQWTEQAQLGVAGANPASHFGQSVAISDDTASGKKRVAIGAPDDGKGTASWFLGSGTTWALETTQTSMGAVGDKFGTAVGVSNDRVIVGAPGYNSSDGYAAIFEPVAMVWTAVATFLGTASSGEKYGFAVAIDGNLAVAGAPARGGMTTINGGGYDTFLRMGGTWTKTQVQSSPDPNRLTGYALAISGPNVIDGLAGGMGDAYVDQFDLATGVTSGGIELLLPAGVLQAGDMYGSAVAIAGNLAVVGAANHNGQAGDVWVFQNIGTNWVYQPPAVVHKTPTPSERFGNSVAVQNGGGLSYIVVGAPGNSTAAASSGAFYEIIQRKQNGDPCAADSECASDFCIDDVCCNSACGRLGSGSAPKTDCQSCLASDTGGTDGTCAALNIRQQCHAAIDLCDRAAFCQAGNMICPSNPMATAGTVCRAASPSNLCDAPEVCDGLNPTCPADAKRPSGTVCRSAVGPCDADETCDGTSDTCPTDLKQPMGMPCRLAAPTDLCDVTESCDGTSNTCPADAVVASGTSCRMATGECDIGESCDGINKTCPFDAMQVDGVTCAAGTCQSGSCRSEADLEVALSANPLATQHQDPVTFIGIVQNHGPSASAMVQAKFSANDGGVITSAAGSGWTCQVTPTSATCTRPDLPSGMAENVTLSITPPLAKRQFSLSALVTADTYDPQENNNTATIVVQNQNPQSPVLAGGGIGCATTRHPTGPTAPALLAIALLGLLRRRRAA